MSKLKEMWGHTKDGHWIDLRYPYFEGEFTDVVFTEELSKEELKDMYPELYARKYEKVS